MDNPKLSRALRDLPNRVLNVAVEERLTLFQNVSDVLDNPGVNSAIIRGICKVIGTTLSKYKDAPSQLLVRKLICDLTIFHHDLTIEHMLAVIKTLLLKELPLIPAPKSCRPAVVALGWICLLLKNANRDSNIYKTEKLRLFEYQSMLYQTTLLAQNTRVTDAATKILYDLWENNNIFNDTLTSLFQMDANSNITILIMAMIRFETEHSQLNILKIYKIQIIEYFVKSMILCKSKPENALISACQPLLSALNNSEFSQYIYNDLQKSMLRSPENTLESVGLIFNLINIDCSPYAGQIATVLIKNLYSKGEVARTESLQSLKSLSQKCSDVKIIKTLLELIFSILNGSDGKINVVEHRIKLLQGAGYLSFNDVHANELPEILNLAADLFSKALDTESQEKVICCTLEMFALWCGRFKDEVPSVIINIFKTGIEHKNTTQAIRQSYLEWLLSSMQNADVKNTENIVPKLYSLYSKALQQSSQLSNISEAACIACILLILETPSDLYPVFWTSLFDLNKQYFFNEKLLATATAETLCHISFIAKVIFKSYLDQVRGPIESLHKALLHNLCSCIPKVRTYTKAQIEEIIKCSDGVDFVKLALREYSKLINSPKYINEIDNCNELAGTQAYVDALEVLCGLQNVSYKDSVELTLSLLEIANCPTILFNNPYFWETTIQNNFDLNPESFIAKNKEQIIEKYINNFKISPVYENVISSIVRINPQTIVPHIIDHIKAFLKADSNLSVSNEEFFIFMTPDGELYDKSVIPHVDSQYKTSGVKRENKVYSYKEQLEEIQLRREIDEKRQKEGKSKTVKLTQKQQELIKNQTEKEMRIKLRVQDMHEKLMSVISLFKASCSGNEKFISLNFYTLLDDILRATHNSLCAEPLTDLYYFLHKMCFKTHSELGRAISIATIRLQKPSCTLKDEWIEKNINENIIDIISDLKKYVIINSNILDSQSFSYAFEFLKRAITYFSNNTNEEFILICIKLIEMHVKRENTSTVESNHPKYLPRLGMFRILLYLMQNNYTPIQTQAVNALLEVAIVSSGGESNSTPDYHIIELFLDSLQHESDTIRDVALRAIKIMINPIVTYSKTNADLNKKIISRLWIAKFDISTDIRQLAVEIWDITRFSYPEFDDIICDITHPELCIQKASAESLIPIIVNNDKLIKYGLMKMLDIYNEKLTLIPPKLDKFDREIEPASDQWKPRRGVAIAISQIAQFLSIEDINYLMQFMVSNGLGDREEIVHKEMLAAALKIVDLHGKETIISLLPVFEEFLDKAPKSQSYDNIRQAVVILMGSLARHLEKEDKRIDPIVKRLITALSTPSQQVQEAVSNCLPHLMPSVKDEAPAMVKKLLHSLTKSDKYGERRGAAYGIAGIVKGLGILSLKQLDIMSKLTSYIQDKKNYRCREGALFAFEILCTTLGRLFEPYIVHVLPHLLQCFGDSSQYVRQAADDTAKVVMGKLSAHGVKLVLPSLLQALDEDSWRTKTASVELLGAMAFCAPKQLSSCLPSIVPKLIEVLGDSHTKVQEAGADALKVIGSVIKNPEIQAIVPVLLRALEDPSNNTSACLQSLLKTKFIHFIDAPSLALIMPVVQRAFMDRSTETRKMAAQIIGNMYSLTDQKDLTPYLPSIIPGLKSSLLDPVPEVRAVSARALGAMVKGMGETSFEDLLPWLMQTLTSESSSVDRSGAAQGLSEVVGGLGVEKMYKLMPEIISTAERTDIAPHVKDGYIMMFIYMPGAFPEEFTPYIGQIINPILKALADESEYVRDTALKAGQRIVNLYAETAVALLLPELEKGLFDENWRIRYSSVQLLGDLLYRISGVSGKMTTETASEDDNFGTEQSHTAIIRFLGDERRNRVLSGLYMGRSDVSLMVRQSALHVWKIVVTNTPRTLREILPTLFGLLLGCLASTSYDKRQVAARTLGDLVRKLGERVLPEIIPILESGLNSEHPDQRQGVCIGLSEIMASTSKEMVLTFVHSLVPTVRKALTDPLPEVRVAAAKTFESLHSTVGSRALDDILPYMLEGLSDPDPSVAENALDGLRQVMSIKSRVVLPYLVPQLTAQPVNTKALSILVSVAGDALTKYLPKILSALLETLSQSYGSVNETQELEYCQTVILSVTDEVGIRTIMDTLMMSAKSENVCTRKSSASLLSAFCIHSPGDYSQYIPQLLRCLLRLMADSDKIIIQNAWEALNAVIKGLSPTDQIGYVSDLRQAVRFAASDLKESELPGFCLPKGITPLLPVFREAILNGLPEEKENAAQGLGEVIFLTSANSLQPSVVHITGPLIRILGDRFNSGVKAAVLETLAILLHKVGVILKQFLPQLQTTFLKALHDQNRNVRMKAGKALSELVAIHSRADPLFIEIHNGIKSSDDSSVRETMLHALRSIISPSGDKMSEQIKKQIFCTLISLIGHQEDTTRNAVGGCLGAMIKYMPSVQISDLLNNCLITDSSDDSFIKHGYTIILFVALKECPKEVLTENFNDRVIANILVNIISEKVPIASNAVRAATYLLEYKLLQGEDPPSSLIVALARAMNHSSNDVKQLVAKSCIHLSKNLYPDQIHVDVLKILVPTLVNGTKEKNGYVKSNSELALISILRLRSDETMFKKTCDVLETGARDSLNDVVTKVLKKVAVHATVRDEELDDTLQT
ncbi:eIF-2-alpha kinase activator GCN1 isoform X2 [Drosophila hydei]|uniref:EIF-2-alpha kinase activator GCN1 isoform X1 n=1 Tax=Drosophila hydei TaxID=7224 RepID=A0A6J2SZK2_DROHY|nr:eIF-2-alpha kinase activator GCN1 isoform X1 [Drosophila hydei]XP_030081575.1 eIF-2-alpha kinase activator GCN1 isoform X2 [Drosophila hydei]